MRLLEVRKDGTVGLTKDLHHQSKRYAILSHTWGNDEDEVTFQDLASGQGSQKFGYRKVEFCQKQAAIDGLSYFWVDTCCIDKTNNTELSEAINSMFRWYQDAAKCYVYLSDVSKSHLPVNQSLLVPWEIEFRKSRWLTRGWTLQELLAPQSVEFFSLEGQKLGDKHTLEQPLREITGIAIEALQGRLLSEFSPVERMAWSKNRQTKREEDKAYCLLGIFGVHLPLIYGEGEDNAFRRLRGEIERLSGTKLGERESRKVHFIVPLGRNTAFVGRGETLTSLTNRIPPHTNKDDCQITVIEGLGGIGKTQIALEAAYRVRHNCPDCSIFWAPVVTMITFENAYRTIGRALGVSSIDDDKLDIKMVIKDALEREDVGSWLLVLDNIDDVDALNNIRDYIPFHRKGSILVTTRNHEVTSQLDILPRDSLMIAEMSQGEALEMLKSGLQEKQFQDNRSTEELLECLTRLPLAIKQATAYMTSTGISTTQYLEYYQKSGQQQIKLLSREFRDRGRYREIMNPIATTWLISFKTILRKHPLAAMYLKFICFLADKDIPRSLLPEGDNSIEKVEAIAILRGYAFILERQQSESFDIHRLVRLIMQDWIEPGDRITQITDVIAHFSKIYPPPRHQNRLIWMSYMPHAQAVLGLSQDSPNFVAKATLLSNLAESFKAIGKYEEAEQMQNQALELRKEALGLQHPDTLSSMNYLATVLCKQGKYDEAEHIHRQALGLYKEILGLQHPDTLSSMDYLANVLRKQGKYDEAEQIQRQTLGLRKQVLGLQHPDTLTSMNNLAMVLHSQKKYDEAEQIQRQTLGLRKQVLGLQHPSTSNSMTNLATVLENQGNYNEAELICREALEVSKTVLGREHPATRRCRYKLQSCLEKIQG